jgi:hypothetical protein
MGMPAHGSEHGITGALLIVGIVFLIGKEREAREALESIAGQDFSRKTPMKRPAPWLRKRRRQSTCSILACAFYFRDEVPSTDMLDIIYLLASLSVDASLQGFNDVLTPVIRNAVTEDEDLWQRLREEFPQACEMIEADRTPAAPGDSGELSGQA